MLKKTHQSLNCLKSEKNALAAPNLAALAYKAQQQQQIKGSHSSLVFDHDEILDSRNGMSLNIKDSNG